MSANFNECAFIVGFNYGTEQWHTEPQLRELYGSTEKQTGNVMVFVMDMTILKSKIPLVAINYNRHWAVVNQLHIHHCAKAASLRADA